MHRREFLKATVATFAAPAAVHAQGERWRTFEVATELRVDAGAAAVTAWLPLAYAGAGEWQRVIKQAWRGNAATMRAVREEGAAGILLVEWGPEDAPREVSLTLHVAAREPETDWTDRTARGVPPKGHRYLRPIRSIVLPGGAQEAARRIAGGERDDVSRGRAIYEWVLGARLDAAVDPSALFVALMRAAGTPARVTAGVRVPGDVSGAQLLRAEFHSSRYGWVPVDPAAARRALGESDGTASVEEYVRRRYFGRWSGPWVAFNDAHDVRLPNDATAVQPFFARPQAAPGPPRYSISARELGVGTAG